MSTPPRTPEEIAKLVDADRKRTHDYFFSVHSESIKATITYSVEFMKLAAAIGSAGFAGCIALIPTRLAQSQPVQPLTGAAWYFAASVLTTLAVAGVAYLAQLCFTHGSARVKMAWEHPYYDRSCSQRVFNALGTGLQVAGILGAGLAIGLLYWAGTLILDAVGRP